MNQLDSIKQFTTVVADSGDIELHPPLPSGRRHHQPLSAAEGRRPGVL